MKMKFAPAVIYKDKVIFGASENYYHDDSHGIYALDKMTGIVKWTFDGEHQMTHNGSADKEGFLTSPCVINDFVYVASNFGNLYAIDAKNGDLKWKFKYITDDAQDTAICYGDTVYIGTSVDYQKGALYAIDARTGALKWQYNTGDKVYTPRVNNNSIYFGTAEHNPWHHSNYFLYALNSRGELKWKFETDGLVVTSPITNRGNVYFTTFAGSLYALDEKTGAL